MKSLAEHSVNNHVIVNLVMFGLLIGGVYAAQTLVREMFPESRPDKVLINAPYPGATPLEVEKGLALRIEEAIKDIEDIDEIETQIGEGAASIMITMDHDVDDLDQSVNDFKAAIDTIPQEELPEEAEEIQVARFEPRLPVISVTMYGDVPEAKLKAAGERLRDDILVLPGISDVQLSGTRKSELSVEIQPEKLIEYGIGLQDVAAAISAANLDLPAGQVKTRGQNVALRTLGETDEAATIAETIVKTTPNGEVVRVRDLGGVIDAFEDRELRATFNNLPAVSVTVYKTGEQDAIDIAEKVKAFAAAKAGEPLEISTVTRMKNALGIRTAAQQIYAEARAAPYPPELTVETHSNLARFIEGRLDLLRRNGSWGLLFVFISLLLFLNWRVAWWVMMGLIISLCGAVMLMQMVGATLNLISMFGLIVVLGIIVDDAIIVGENIYARFEQGEPAREAAINGTAEVTWPVIIAVLTTIGAFLPLLFVEGQIGDFMGVLPVVVICALSISLVEALSILPAHLADWLRPLRGEVRGEPPRNIVARIARPIRKFETHLLMDVLRGGYARLLRAGTRYRYVTLAVVIGVFIATMGLVEGRRVNTVWVQKMDSETVMANLEMPVGSPVEETLEAISVVNHAALNLSRHNPDLPPKQQVVRNVWTLVGAQMRADERGMTSQKSSHIGQVIIELETVENRDRSSTDIIRELREKTTDLAGINSLVFQEMQGGPAGAEIELEVTGERIADILAAGERLQALLRRQKGVYDIADDYEAGRRELQIELLDAARPLGITTRWLATEIRGAFYGIEARTLQRGREDVDIRVRFPEERRREIYELESMWVATPGGGSIPFREVARIADTRGTAGIRRVDQRRAVVVSADVDQATANSAVILEELADDFRALEREYPGLQIHIAGSSEEFARSFDSIERDFAIAVIMIYFMLAGLFRSYLQPLVVLTAVPFGMIGAVLGHYWMGYPLTILSYIGMVALTGIVVNDALILVSFINNAIRSGTEASEAVMQAGLRRLRPILLTSATTILGLAPMLAETSFQAKFLIPMAISISAGLAFATVLTLVLVPANYLILLDLKRLATWAWRGRDAAREVSPA